MSKEKQNAPFSWRFTLPLYLGSTLNPVNSLLIATTLSPLQKRYTCPLAR